MSFPSRFSTKIFDHNQYSAGKIAYPRADSIVYTEVQQGPLSLPHKLDPSLTVTGISTNHGVTTVDLSGGIFSAIAQSPCVQTATAKVIGNGKHSILLQGNIITNGLAGSGYSINFVFLLSNNPSRQPGINKSVRIPNERAGIVYHPACFKSGTRFRTPHGDIAVENLSVGDLVLTASGTIRPIRWLGHRRIDCRRHPQPRAIWPVRVAAHAFGPGRPARDLRVSPCHAICVDVMGEVLVPASALVNGTSIVQEEVEAVTYWHVELESHDILLAENLPAESYLDMGNRGFFAESKLVALHAAPDAPARTHTDFCRPFTSGGAIVDTIRARLAVIARGLGTPADCAEQAA